MAHFSHSILRYSGAATKPYNDAKSFDAEAAGYRRLWLITTNDNTRAIRFYQGWGMDLCAFYRHELYLSERTSENHVSKMLRKLDLASRTEIAFWATERRLRAPTPDQALDTNPRAASVTTHPANT